LLLLELGKSDISDKSFWMFCMIIIAVEDEQAEREAHVTVEFYHHDGTVVIRPLVSSAMNMKFENFWLQLDSWRPWLFFQVVL